MNKYLTVIPLFTLLESCVFESGELPPPHAKSVFPIAETAPITSRGDSADDTAIWLDPADPASSLIMGTDKEKGLEVYTLDGRNVQSMAVGKLNNVDIRLINDQRWSAIAAASNQSTNSISLFSVDKQGGLQWLQTSEIPTGLTEVYGLCMFNNDQGMQVFVNDKDGRYQQWLLLEDEYSDIPKYSGKLVREFKVPSQPEGCVVDDENEKLFLGVEAEGIRVVDANYEMPVELVPLYDTDGEILSPDVEGMSIYKSDTSGYLVASSQGNNSFAVYDRLPPYSYRGSFTVGDNPVSKIDGAHETDGVSISSFVQTDLFPSGLLVVQDGYNTQPRALQNFKIISWQHVADALGI